MPKPKLKNATITYNRVIDLFYFASKTLFSRREEIFLTKDKFLPTDYPTAILSNHVSPLDVPALAVVYRRLLPKIRMIIPTREDMLQKNFLVKEFRPKGIAKFFMHLVDLSNLGPLVLAFIGCVPIKRPFRDNSRAMLKEGSLRDQVDKEWDTLKIEIESGRNLFMFPEGTFNRDGFLSPIKRGPWVLVQKIPNLKFVSFTLTYDTLSAKNDLYITFNGKLERNAEDSENQFLAKIKETFGKGYAIHPGNLIAYLLLRFKPKSLPVPSFVSFILSFIKEIQSRFPEIPIASDWSNLETRIKIITSHLKSKASWNKDEIHFDPSLFVEPEDHYSQKSHPLHYYRNQLQIHLPSLAQISFDTYPFLLSNDI